MTGLEIGEQRGDAPGRRQSDLNDAPWPARFVVAMGIAGTIALYLVHFLAQNVDRKLEVTTKAIEQHVESSVTKEFLLQLEGNRDKLVRQQIRIMRQNCVNGAKNAEERRLCDPPEQ